MNHQQAKGLFEDYASERLDPALRDELEEHLATCPECRSLLDGTAPVDVSSLGSIEVDERALRRSVRRTLWYTAFQAAGILLALLVGLAVISTLVVQPLLMDRGGRAAAVARATYDVVSLFNEGAVVTDYTIDSGVFDRTFTAQAKLPVGSGMTDLGTVSTRVGVLGSPKTIWPFFDSSSRIGAAQDVLGRLGEGTVSTVAVRFYQPISVDQAQSLTDSTIADVSVIWAGFLLTDAAPDVAATDPLRTLGYSTRVGTDQLEPRLFGASSANAGGAFGSDRSSVMNALQEVRRSLNHLAANPDVAARLFDGAEQAVQRAAAYLADNEPQVETLVVTGPSNEILRFFDEAGTKDGTVLAVDFYNWSRPSSGG